MNKFFTILLTAAVLNACAAPSAPHPTDPHSAAQSAAERFPATAAELSKQAEALTARIKKPANTLLTHYDADGNEQSNPAAKGYYRMLLGHTAKGGAVVQDFYQDSKTKQTDPLLIADAAKIKSFNAEDSEGRTVWYNRDGEVMYFGDYHNGRQLRSGYYQNGRLVLTIDNMSEADRRADMTGYYPDGQKLFSLSPAHGSVLYYRNGQKLFAKAGSDAAEQYWHPDGKPAKRQEVLNAILTTDKRIKNLLNRIKAEKE